MTNTEGPAGLTSSAAGGTPKVKVVTSGVTLRRRVLDLSENRELLASLIRTEIKVKYKNSILGILWTMVAPAIILAIYWVVFGLLLKNGIPDFVIYLASGLLVWTFFANSIVMATAVIVARAGIVKKVSFPREILSIATVGSQSVYLLLQWVVLALFMVVLGHSPDWVALPLVPVAFFTVLLYAVAFGVLLSAVNVYFRDTQHLIEIFIQAWFWLTPIVYSFWHNVHGHGAAVLSWIYLANPMTPVVLAFQRALYGRPIITNTETKVPEQILPPWHLTSFYGLLGLSIIGGFVLLGIAIRVFSRLEGNFAEEL